MVRIHIWEVHDEPYTGGKLLKKFLAFKDLK